MARLRITMNSVPAPKSAPSHARGDIDFQLVADKYHDAITSAEHKALVARHKDILAKVDSLVVAYAVDQSAPPGEDWFPAQDRFTGEYYIGSESYHRLPGESWIQVCVEARCLAHSPSGPSDYLGLHVWLRYDPKSGRLTNHRNTDSMVI
jgi:hypothetical protein